MRVARLLLLGLLLGTFVATGAPPAHAETIGHHAFGRVWARTDQPVAAGRANRTWIWGPAPITPLLSEPYAEGDAGGVQGQRWVQYFDKARMEITQSSGDRNAPGYVTNGLLAQEMITGRIQIGADQVLTTQPATITIAGDADDPDAPTYATFQGLLDEPATPEGELLIQSINRDGQITTDPDLAEFGTTAAVYIPETQHAIASVFWEFMHSTGPIHDQWEERDGPLFSDPFFATGFPISEAYWTEVRVGGEPRRVLVQAFERRILTYTPDNPEGWQVEAGNVGQHYYAWRYLNQGENPLRITNISSRKDNAGKWVFIGALRNTAQIGYESIGITVKLYAADDSLIANRTAYLDLGIVGPGEELPFRVWLDTGEPFARAKVTTAGRPTGHLSRPKVTVIQETATGLNTPRATVTGQVRNDTDRPLRYVTYVLALYDKNGRVVGYDWGFADPADLEPGARATVTATVYNPPPTAVRIKLFATGR